MKKLLVMPAVALALSCAFVSTAQAQATRTWVSGVGDDVNPCSRTAPCKTFAGAISKTATGGEINCLDPGGFGAVTIVKSITLDCDYTEGGMLAGGNGIVINATASSVVRLRGLDVFGVNPPTHGIRILVAGAVTIDHVRVSNFNAANSWGINFTPSGTTELFISDSLVTDNGSGSTGGGIQLAPTGSGVGRVSIVNTRVVNNAQGIRADTTSSAALLRASIRDSAVANNTLDGIAAVGATGGVRLMIDSSDSSFNGGAGYTAFGNAKIRLGRSTSTGNVTGYAAASGGAIETYSTNQNNGNDTDGAGTPIPQN